MPELSERAKKLLSFVQKNRNDSFSKFALALELWKLDFPTSKVEALFKDILQSDPNYIGLYYHYGALLEQTNRADQALDIYQKGIEKAKLLNEQHALSELMNAKTQLEMDL